MGAKILTGYTGEKHITPLDDAAVYRALVGPDSYILDEANNCVAEMPSINGFTIHSGLISIQGIQARISRETLSVDTCPTGKARIDLVVARYTHDTNSLIDDVELMLLKGTEVDDTNTPPLPEYYTGNIEDGATTVDMLLYKISLRGSTVTFSREASIVNNNIYESGVITVSTSFSTLPKTIADDRITSDMVVVNTEIGSPAVQTGDWTVTTTDGSLTISGTVSGTTNLNLYLMHSR